MIGKVDQLMPTLETLAIDNVITQRDLDLQKALFKKMIKTVASGARVFAGGLRRRMTAMDQNREVAAIDDEQTTADQPQPGRKELEPSNADTLLAGYRQSTAVPGALPA